MPSLKNRIDCTSTEEADENPCRLCNCNLSIFKTQGGPRDNPKNYYWEKTPQNKSIDCPGKTITPHLKVIFNF
jgi:hypothetical protein